MAKLCTNTLFRVVLGTQSPAHLADSIRVVLDARAVEAGRAIAAEHPQTTGTTPGSDQALARVHRFLDQLICSRRREPEDQEDILSMLICSSNVGAENGLGQARDELRIRDETISMLNASLDVREFCVRLPPDQPDVEPVVGIVVSSRSDLRLIVRRLDTAEQRREL